MSRRSRARWRVLREFAAAARRHDARIAAIGTEALRRAPNAAAFLGPAAEILGTEVEVIDGEREAALTFRAVVASFPDLRTGPLAVVDIGGGSTEIVLADSGRGRLSNQPAPRIGASDGSASFTTTRRPPPSARRSPARSIRPSATSRSREQAHDAGRRRRNGHVARRDGARAARATTPRASTDTGCRAPTSAVRSRAWAPRPRRSASG